MQTLPWNFASGAGRGVALAALLAGAVSVACGSDGGGNGPDGNGTVAGTVTNIGTGAPLEGAVVSIGTRQATTAADGGFELTGVATGAATIRGAAPGFADYEASVTVSSGANTHDIGLTFEGVLAFGSFAVYLAPQVTAARGVLIVLGGPNTRGFANGDPMGAPTPELEAQVQALAQGIRSLAAGSGLMVLGSSQQGMANSAATDQTLLGAIQTAAASIGHPELVGAPVFLLGLSSGAPPAVGFAQRNAVRVLGLLLKVPVTRTTPFLASPPTRTVPAYFLLGERDAQVDSDAFVAAHDAGRGEGAPWGLAIEPGAEHSGVSDEARSVVLGWIAAALGIRMPGTPSDPIPAVEEASGWLGNLATSDVAAWDDYAGDRASATWFPSQATALQWKALMTP